MAAVKYKKAIGNMAFSYFVQTAPSLANRNGITLNTINPNITNVRLNVVFRTVVILCNLIKRKDVKLTIRMHAVFHLGVMRHMVVVCNL